MSEKIKPIDKQKAIELVDMTAGWFELLVKDYPEGIITIGEDRSGVRLFNQSRRYHNPPTDWPETPQIIFYKNFIHAPVNQKLGRIMMSCTWPEQYFQDDKLGTYIRLAYSNDSRWSYIEQDMLKARDIKGSEYIVSTNPKPVELTSLQDIQHVLANTTGLFWNYLKSLHPR